jgi:hypothetical protein
MAPYYRYAKELFPEFKQEPIPVARFLCRLKGLTFSLLPIQLVPYVQYTIAAIIGTLLLGLGARRQGQTGFQGAVLAVDPESLVTPWLVVCWLALVRQRTPASSRRAAPLVRSGPDPHREAHGAALDRSRGLLPFPGRGPADLRDALAGRSGPPLQPNQPMLSLGQPFPTADGPTVYCLLSEVPPASGVLRPTTWEGDFSRSPPTFLQPPGKPE